MPNHTIHFSRPMTPVFFAGASHDDVKWTINYLMGLLEKPEEKKEEIAPMSIREAKAILRQKKLKSHKEGFGELYHIKGAT